MEEPLLLTYGVKPKLIAGRVDTGLATKTAERRKDGAAPPTRCGSRSPMPAARRWGAEDAERALPRPSDDARQHAGRCLIKPVP
jgi:hypothetical protein